MVLVVVVVHAVPADQVQVGQRALEILADHRDMLAVLIVIDRVSLLDSHRRPPGHLFRPADPKGGQLAPAQVD